MNAERRTQNFTLLEEMLEVKLLSGQVGAHHVTGTACLSFFFSLVHTLLQFPKLEKIPFNQVSLLTEFHCTYSVHSVNSSVAKWHALQQKKKKNCRPRCS